MNLMSPLLINPLRHFGMGLLGLLSWACWAARTVSCIQGRPCMVFVLVMIEELVGILALYLIVKNKKISETICYAIGGAIGAALMTWLSGTI